MDEELTPEKTFGGRRFTFKDGVWKIYVEDDSDETFPIHEMAPLIIRPLAQED